MTNLKKTLISALLATAVVSFPAFAKEHSQPPHHPSHPTPSHEGQPSDAVKKELQDYHSKKKELRENLSPEAKEHMKKRHEKRKEMRKEKREERREDRKENHDKKPKVHNPSNQEGGPEQGGQY